jgi:hypothetical protein
MNERQPPEEHRGPGGLSSKAELSPGREEYEETQPYVPPEPASREPTQSDDAPQRAGNDKDRAG